MKARDVPQDPGACYEGHQRLTWAVGEDGRYTGVPTIGWEAEIEATRVTWEATSARRAQAWEDARAERTSPLAYHMVAAQMDVGLLASETGIWAWRVRRHLRADVFRSLSPALLARYADALGLTVESLVTLPPGPE